MNENFNGEYGYSFLHKLVYRYGNIPATTLLILYLVPLLAGFRGHLFEYFYIALLTIAIIALNYWFLQLYQSVPGKIIVADDTITGTQYFMSSKEVTLNVKEIDSLKGGVFEAKHNGIMHITSKNTGKKIVFFHTLRDGKKFQAYILSRVSKSLYDSVMSSYGARVEAIRKKAEVTPTEKQ